MNNIPEDFELLGFFETEPKMSSGISDLMCTKSVYCNTFDNESIVFSLEPQYSEIKIEISREGTVTAEYALNRIQMVEIKNGWKTETLVVSFEHTSGLMEFKLRLKPFIKVEWGNKKNY